jgi:hypothetical protein
MINVDHGILPAATTELRADLNLSEIDLGTLGSVVYLGLVFGKSLPFEFMMKYRIPVCHASIKLLQYKVRPNRMFILQLWLSHPVHLIHKLLCLGSFKNICRILLGMILS